MEKNMENEMEILVIQGFLRMITNVMVPCSLCKYSTSDGPQNDIGNYLGPCSSLSSTGRPRRVVSFREFHRQHRAKFLRSQAHLKMR